MDKELNRLQKEITSTGLILDDADMWLSIATTPKSKSVHLFQKNLKGSDATDLLMQAMKLDSRFADCVLEAAAFHSAATDAHEYLKDFKVEKNDLLNNDEFLN